MNEVELLMGVVNNDPIMIGLILAMCIVGLLTLLTGIFFAIAGFIAKWM